MSGEFLFTVRVDGYVSVRVEANIDDVRMAADRTVFRVLLALAFCHVNGYDDVFTATFANIGCFFMHDEFASAIYLVCLR